MDALLKDSEHLAAMIDNVSSVDNLDFIMESDALGHTVMDQRQGHESLVAIAGTVTLEEVFSVQFFFVVLRVYHTGAHKLPQCHDNCILCFYGYSALNRATGLPKNKILCSCSFYLFFSSHSISCRKKFYFQIYHVNFYVL